MLLPSLHALAKEDEQMVVRLATENQLIPLYLAKFVDQGSGLNSAYIRSLEEVLTFDLNHNGMTYTTPCSSQFETLANKLAVEGSDNMAPWRVQRIFYVIKVHVEKNKTLAATLYAVSGETAKHVDGLPLLGELKQDRHQIHQLADAIHKALFGADGIATTHILYTIRNQTGPKSWSSEIWEADYDGANPRRVIQDRDAYLVTPVYVPPKAGFKTGSFFYVAYQGAQPKIYMASLKEGVGRRLMTLRSNQLMPAISRQRDQVAFISDVTGNPDLFLQPFNADVGALGKPQQIFAARKATQGSPAFSPDGSQLAFVSNKDGAPRIYIMNVPAPGTSLKDIQVELITKHSKESSAPSWSPDASKLAYCALVNGVRQIWIYDFNTREERQLTQGGGNKENPSWAPNSLSLVYNRSDGDSCDLFLINLNQPNATKISSGTGEKRFPNWEPR